MWVQFNLFIKSSSGVKTSHKLVLVLTVFVRRDVFVMTDVQRSEISKSFILSADKNRRVRGELGGRRGERVNLQNMASLSIPFLLLFLPPSLPSSFSSFLFLPPSLYLFSLSFLVFLFSRPLFPPSSSSSSPPPLTSFTLFFPYPSLFLSLSPSFPLPSVVRTVKNGSVQSSFIVPY